MLKLRLSKICNATLLVLCVLFTGSFILSSCQDLFDDYKYDDEEPEWLGSSIYDFLKDETSKGVHTYNNYIAIIDSLGYKDILSRTGSKTLFVADDAAFDRFYANNRWGVNSIEDLTKSQMTLLLRSAMLDNAYLLDMMSSSEGNPPTEGACLRRVTATDIYDSVPYLQPDRLPQHNKKWDRFREKGIRVAIDGTRPMMVHFLNDYLRTNNITDRDMQIIFNGQKRAENEAYIYQNKVLSSGIKYADYSDDTLTVICKNGYIYRLDNTLIPPSNMAEELRHRPNTRLFSRMLDRFSVPVFDAEFDRKYDAQYTALNDSAFMFRYLNRSSNRGLVDITKDYKAKTDGLNDENVAQGLLLFDPGWNQYQDGTITAEKDMAAIFVPSDEYVYDYFKNGLGRDLVDRFAPEVAITDDIYSIQPALDSIPNNIIVEFVNNLMQKSFVSSVPSKFDKVQNDGYEPLGVTEGDVAECVVANNGVIYILNNVFGPAKYRSVAAPPLILENMTIMNALINKLLYSSYLLAMEATYSFIVPDNEYFVYYDPVTLKREGSTGQHAYRFYYDNKYPDASETDDPKLWARVSKFDPATYTIINDSLDTYVDGSAGDHYKNFNAILKNRATDLMEYLIIVGDVEDGNKYYQSKGYGFIKCEGTGENITFYGGENLENGTSIKVKAGGRHKQENGVTYCTISGDPNYPSGIPTPPTMSVYDRVNPAAHGQEEFTEFYKLAAPRVPNPADATAMMSLSEIISAVKSEMYKTENVTGTDEQKKLENLIYKYSIFSAAVRSIITPSTENVPFFGKYHYTVYVPSNEAVQQAYTDGLPKWDDVVAEIAAGDTLRAVEMIRLLNKVARYHFQDNAVFVDNKDFSKRVAGEWLSRVNFETAAINNANGRFYELWVETKESPYGSGKTLSVTDQMNNVAYVLNTANDEGRTWNIMARDLAMTGTSAAGATSLSSSAFSVVHSIDRVLRTKEFMGYDGKFVRFTNDGLKVDSMSVSGADADDCYLKDNGNKYLVASYDEIIVTAADGARELHRVAYLLQPKADTTIPYELEEYVLDANGEKILITDQGFRVKVVGGQYLFCNDKGETTDAPTHFFSNDGSSTPLLKN